MKAIIIASQVLSKISSEYQYLLDERVWHYEVVGRENRKGRLQPILLRDYHKTSDNLILKTDAIKLKFNKIYKLNRYEHFKKKWSEKIILMFY